MLERHVTARNRAEAFETALGILSAIDTRFGRLDLVEVGTIVAGDNDEDIALGFCTRFAAALGQLIAEPGFVLSGIDFERLLLRHRWIDLIFALSGFRSSDHLVPLLAKIDGNRISFGGNNFLRLLAIRSMNSGVEIDLDEYARASPGSLLAFLFYLSSHFVFGSRAFDLRERLLEWLPTRLDEMRLGPLALSYLHNIYMHCSYGLTPGKHRIKRDLMGQMRRACLEAGCTEIAAGLPVAIPERPTIIVAAENFHHGHSVYRSHSRAIASLRARFHVVGVLCPQPNDIEVDEFFDECIPVPTLELLASVRGLCAEIAARRPHVIFYLGVGMTAELMALASLRLAPIQCVSFGHTATTMSEAMDYFILPEDFAGTPETFSEKLLTVPKAAMPFALRTVPAMQRPSSDGIVRIAVSASTMKLNPRLFDALARIAAQAKAKIEIQFFPLLASGLAYFELARVVRARIPSALVFPEMPHELYLERLGLCDLFLCPFPYGNMNSIIDAFSLGIPGVCLDGPESHSHADTAFFGRVGLPRALCARSVDDYIGAALKLIDDVRWREECRQLVAAADLDKAFFRGDPRLFCDTLASLVRGAEMR